MLLPLLRVTSNTERIRGQTRKMKVMENAREAVANGSAGKEEIPIATSGADVENDGKGVPAPAGTTNRAVAFYRNGVLHTPIGKGEPAEDEEEALPRHRSAQPGRLGTRGNVNIWYVSSCLPCRLDKPTPVG